MCVCVCVCAYTYGLVGKLNVYNVYTMHTFSVKAFMANWKTNATYNKSMYCLSWSFWLYPSYHSSHSYLPPYPCLVSHNQPPLTCLLGRPLPWLESVCIDSIQRVSTQRKIEFDIRMAKSSHWEFTLYNQHIWTFPFSPFLSHSSPSCTG